MNMFIAILNRNAALSSEIDTVYCILTGDGTGRRSVGLRPVPPIVPLSCLQPPAMPIENLYIARVIDGLILVSGSIIAQDRPQSHCSMLCL
jgi:hypothetical protein